MESLQFAESERKCMIRVIIRISSATNKHSSTGIEQVLCWVSRFDSIAFQEEKEL